jgi:phosphoribosylformimino-5-aminoimidazole carboxamide ribotide isomerase
MQIIPVIDLMHGQVVHAQQGQRQRYQAIKSQLCDSSEALTIVQKLMELYAFPSLYIADIDAIQGTGQHWGTIQQIRQRYPALHIWLDAGFNHLSQLAACHTLAVRPVLGSESMRDMTDYQHIQQHFGADFVLSLDYKDGQFLGDKALLQPQHWPQDLILMTLSKVGSQTGPALSELAELKSQHPNHHIYAAGGLRNLQDALALKQQHIQGALVASALHNGSLGAVELQQLAAS